MADRATDGSGRTRELAGGSLIPIFGLGVWQVPDGPDCVNAVRWALEVGYRHIDTAQAYGNEESVGRALRDSGIPREEVFLTTKFDPAESDAVDAAAGSLRRLGVDQIDLYIVHWPQGGPTRAWPGMEEAQQRGYVRSIGVSNFSVSELERVMAIATRPPAVNQVQFSPFEYRKALLAACVDRRIGVEAYSPLGTGKHLSHPTVAEIAQHIARTPAQVLLRWSIQRGAIVIPKSTHRERIEENSQLFDFELTDGDMGKLDALDRTGGTDKALERKWW